MQKVPVDNYLTLYLRVYTLTSLTGMADGGMDR